MDTLEAEISAEAAKGNATWNETLLERLRTSASAQAWALERWEKTAEATEERARYLKEINITEVCKEDLGVPTELIERYFQGGQNLRCPNGTVSGRGAACLGECRKPPASSRPISILDPVDKRSRTVDGILVEDDNSTESEESGPGPGGGRKRTLQEEEEEAWAERWDKLQPYQLRPLESVRLSVDLRDVPPGFEYNAHYAIVILGMAEEAPVIPGQREQEPWQKRHELGQEQQQLPEYFSAKHDKGSTESGARETVKRAVLELRLFNFRPYDVTFRVGIYLFHGLYRPYLDYLANKVTVEFYRAGR
jgi:hypothetical protein